MATEELAGSPRGEVLIEPAVETRTSWRAVVFRIALATFGLVMLGTIIQRVGADEVLEALSLTAPFLPLTFTLEATRIGCDAWSTYLLLGDRPSPSFLASERTKTDDPNEKEKKTSERTRGAGRGCDNKARAHRIAAHSSHQTGR